MKIIFMGTPLFAVPALKLLTSSSHEVVAVYTQSPKAAGRGYKERLSPIHQFALENNLEVKYPVSLRDPLVQKELIDLRSDIIVVAAYGLILPEAILSAPKYGSINIHPSLLPKWRGAAPIQRTVLAGDNETGVCIMKLVQKLDAGAILSSYKMPLNKDITSSALHDQLSNIGADLLLQTLDNIDNCVPVEQSEISVTYADKLSKEEGLIRWNYTAEYIHRMVRALNPWPGVYFNYNNEIIKILETDYIDMAVKEEVGKVLDDNLSIFCSGGILKPKILQRTGRKPMDTSTFLRGFNIPKGTIL
ncbi:Methionyl-tRNA formyltransferase [Rickettsiales bacterium Ac37b]|nr:Methionyl-tRNA formyltransferase [Rickettsiales bacterium Ac37b]